MQTKIVSFLGLLFLVGAMLVSGLGCPSVRMNDTQTIHNRAATRIWIIQSDRGTTDRDAVVYCDIELAQANRDLCISWQGR